MDKFDEFLRQLLSNPSTKTCVSINDSSKTIKAMVHLTTKNYLDRNGDYYKIIFTDNSFLLIMPSEKELYYADRIIGKILEIKDNQIGKDEFLTYNGKKHHLGNKDDYQYVLQLLVGKPTEIEGECHFSDYFPVSGPKEFLSLGWLMVTNERADINCQIIDQNNVKILNN
jgi:hypothetical protein